MRKQLAWAVLGAATLFVVCAGPAQTAPAPASDHGARPAEKWEYAELYFTSRTWRGGEDAPPPIRGGRGGGGAGGPGGAAPGQFVQPAQPVLPRLTVRWVTGEGETTATSWE